MKHMLITTLTLALTLPTFAMNSAVEEDDGSVIVQAPLLTRCKELENELTARTATINERLAGDFSRHFDDATETDEELKETILEYAKESLSETREFCELELKDIGRIYTTHEKILNQCSMEKTQDKQQQLYAQRLVFLESEYAKLLIRGGTDNDKKIIELLLGNAPISYRIFYALMRK
jgi:hypothetical protein